MFLRSISARNKKRIERRLLCPPRFRFEWSLLSTRCGNPSEAIDSRSEIDGPLHLPGAQVENSDLPRAGAADVCNFPVRANQNLRRSPWNLQRPRHLEGVQIDDKETIGSHAKG